MAEDKNKYTFWTKYKRYASNELLLYIIMIVGIVLGILLINYIKINNSVIACASSLLSNNPFSRR